MNIFNLFITYGDTFLPNPNSYDELYYEIIRMHQVFDNLYSMGKLLFVDSYWHAVCSEISCNVKWNVYLAMEIPDCVSFISGQNSDDRVRSCEPNVFLA